MASQNPYSGTATRVCLGPPATTVCAAAARQPARSGRRTFIDAARETLLGDAGSFALAAQAAFQQQPTFRTNAELVPIDVRVVDKDGKAVTDLTREDFAVTEDGVPQTITQFEKESINGDAPPHRAFVIVLGEGRLETPFRSIDALIDFIRALEPNDCVGVIAYNRWAPLTFEHGSTIAVLERYKAQNSAIETALETTRPPDYISGPLEIPSDVRRLIDGVFAGAASAGTDFGESTVASLSDILHLYRGIALLAPMEGERHLILLTEQGSGIVSSSSNLPTRLVMNAADARVAIHIVQTAGYGEKQSVLPPDLTMATHSKMQRLGMVLPPRSSSNSRGARETSSGTGGLAFFYTWPRSALDRIASAISVDYLLGYVPQNAQWDGGYRRITVHVSRPGVTVIHRHGYHAVHVAPVFDGRVAMTDARLSEARSAVRPLHGLTLRLNSRIMKVASEASRIDVELRIQPSQVAFKTAEHRHLASLDVSIWITDRQGETVGTIADRIDLQLTDDSYAKLVKQNIVFTRSVAVTGVPFEIRAGVYDYDNDRLGAVSRRIQ